MKSDMQIGHEIGHEIEHANRICKSDMQNRTSHEMSVMYIYFCVH